MASSTLDARPAFVGCGVGISVTSAGAVQTRAVHDESGCSPVEWPYESLKRYLLTALYSTGSTSHFSVFPVFVQQDWLSPQPKTQIAAIRDAFGTTIQRVAAWLRVERATVYDWLDEGAPRAQARLRIDLLYKLALLWRRMRLGSIDRKPIALDGPDSLDSRLSAEQLDEAQLRTLIVFIANESPALIEPRSLGDELAARGAAEISQQDHASRASRRRRVRTR